MLKVMSFNIRYGLAEDGKNNWSHRKELVVERIRAIDPDLLGIQECMDNFQADYLKSQLPDYHFFGVQRGGPGATAAEMGPLLFKTSLFTLVESGYFWLSQTPEIPGSQGWGSAHPRLATWAKLERKKKSHQLIFLNTHLDYLAEANYQSARFLRERIDQLGQNIPLILTGDFNADRGSASYYAMLDNSLHQETIRDCYQEVHPKKSEGTYHEFGQLEEPPALDWILISNHFVIAEAEIDSYHLDDLYPSDHYPVFASIMLREDLNS